MSDESIQAVVSASHVLAETGLNDMVWGHASVRDPDGRGVWMKSSGWGFEEVDSSKVVLVDEFGHVIVGTGRRHLEYPIHTEIVASRPDVRAVVHTHAPALSAFASLDAPLRPISHDAIPFTDPPIPRFTATGALIDSRNLGRALAAELGEANGILMPNHGAVTVGPNIAAAVMHTVLLERACRTALLALAAGGPRIWSDEAEAAHKREQVWSAAQLTAGWEYLRRRGTGSA